VDAEQIRVIDRVARRVTEPATLAAIDDQVIDAARTRTPKQLHVWLLRLVVRLEPLAFEERHRRASAERRVTVAQGADDLVHPAPHRQSRPAPQYHRTRPLPLHPTSEAITIRAGTCRYPTCTVPADRCDLDHHEPVPKGITSGTNMDPFCRRHHRGKT
jgi:hypothetical protein